ncbi:MAG: TlpA disulfide reductase family protein [Hydrogenovibrio sp.]|nr:TlpA disulfide reductase family protein [Hydrogenovibrio sp.]
MSVQADTQPLTHLDRAQWNAIETVDQPLDNGDSISIKHLSSPAQRLYLWIGKANAPNDGNALFLKHLQQTGNVWFIDTPEALFLNRSRTAMRNLRGDFLVPVIDTATHQFQQVVVISSDVGAVPTLRGIRQWQVQTANSAQRARLKAVALLFPNLYVNTPIAGEKRDLFPIAFQSALPVCMIAAERGAQTNALNEMSHALRTGGSLVTKTIIADSTDSQYRYHEMEKMAKRTADVLVSSVDQLIDKAEKIGYPIARLSPSEALSQPPVSKMVRGMKAFDPPIPMPGNIRLKSVDGKVIDIQKDYAGKALLINFWATWCPHCVEEIPSMNRALKQLDSDRFAMVSISYRDTQAILKKFTQKIQVDFPILMDLDGQVSAKWKVFAFPSSFIVDRQGNIRYSINAGNIWDSEEMLNYLKSVTNEKK